MPDRPENPPVPRNLTALMQHLQMLVGVSRHSTWCGGTISASRFPAFALKMADRYPSIGRNARQRSYDRARGRASVRMVVYPLAAIPRHPSPLSKGDIVGDMVAWWIVSTEGGGGLADLRTPDYHVSHDAMGSSTHIVVGDYVLAYVSKLVRRGVIDRRTGTVRPSWRPTSTWTWMIREPVRAEVRASIIDCCERAQLGRSGSDQELGFGLLGLLAGQRRRPLFSGVRNNVIEFHRLAADTWRLPGRTVTDGRTSDGTTPQGPPSLNDVIKHQLPLMRRLPILGDPPMLLSQALGMASSAAQKNHDFFN